MGSGKGKIVSPLQRAFDRLNAPILRRKVKKAREQTNINSIFVNEKQLNWKVDDCLMNGLCKISEFNENSRSREFLGISLLFSCSTMRNDFLFLNLVWKHESEKKRWFLLELSFSQFSFSSRSLRLKIINLDLVSMPEIEWHFFGLVSKPDSWD